MFRLDHLLDRTADSAPEHVALVEGDRQLSYGELRARAASLAMWLTRTGVKPGDRVGLFVPKCTEAVIALFGIMRAGAVYVPIDASAPVGRAAHIAEDCGLRCVITNGPKGTQLASAMTERGVALTYVVIGTASELPESITGHVAEWEDVVGEPPGVQLPGGTERDLSYILYTSGSTGMPKGVMISHRAALTFVDWACEAFELTQADVVSSHAPLHFDLSVFDIFSAVKAGASIVLFGDGATTFPIQLTRAIERHRISVWYSVPSALTLMLERGKFRELDMSSLRVILFAGEVFPTPQLRKLREATGARLFNLFGPTETNVCTFHEVTELPEDDTKTIPIGVAISNYDVFLMGEDGSRAPAGTLGEIYARGPGLMSGYWGDAAKTGSALVQNPLNDHFHDLVYRTGDLARADEAGLLHFFGRRDHQVKIRGYRVELGEVEAALYSLEDVTEAVTVVTTDSAGEKSIVALVVPDDGATLTPEIVRSHCLERIPRYMIPETVIVTDRLPHTSTGKIDRRAALLMVPDGA